MAKSKNKAKKPQHVKVAKKQGPEQTAKDPLEEEYGPMQEIYVGWADYERLNGNKRRGKRYDVCKYSAFLTSQFSFQTIAPQSALEDGKFHFGRFKPGILAEMRERAFDKKLVLQVEKDKLKSPIRAFFF